MTWFKFLAPGATGPFSGYRWPSPSHGRPGDWVTVTGGFDPCRVGLHLCRSDDLPLWVNAELYEVEATGPLEEYDGFAVVGRARLLRAVPGWAPEASRRFCDSCAWRVRDLAVRRLREVGSERDADALARCTSLPALAEEAEDVSERNSGNATRVAGYAVDAASFAGRVTEAGWAAAAATAGYIAATAARAADTGPDHGGTVLRRERARQARWLVQDLAIA